MFVHLKFQGDIKLEKEKHVLVRRKIVSIQSDLDYNKLIMQIIA